MIEVKEGRYFVGIWLLGDGESRNWLYTAYRDKGKKAWYLTYRFHYYHKNEEGVKKWFGGEVQSTEEQVIKVARGAVAMMEKAGFGDRSEELLIQSDDNQVIVEKIKEHAKTSRYMEVELIPIH